MPWYIAVPITLVLFLLAPFFRKWVDLVLWPKLANWWVSRSRSKTERRIKRLESQLARIESLPLLTEFEKMVLSGFIGIYMIAGMVLATAVMIDFMSIYERHLNHVPVSTSEPGLLVVGALLAFITLACGVSVSTFRADRTTEHKQMLQASIGTLKVQLAKL
jgi:hypothetical protein